MTLIPPRKINRYQQEQEELAQPTVVQRELLVKLSNWVGHYGTMPVSCHSLSKLLEIVGINPDQIKVEKWHQTTTVLVTLENTLNP